MRTTIIACKTLERELNKSMSETGCRYPVSLIESGLHERPNKLRETVQEVLDQICAERVILCIGQCGNAAIGLKSREYEMILPRIDDCLSMLLGSEEAKNGLSVKDNAFFMTEGWLEGETTVVREYERVSKKYGREMAESVLEAMYGHYRTLGILDTGVSPVKELIEVTKPVATLLSLEQKIYPASTAYLKDLLKGPWDNNRFIIKKAFDEVVFEDYVFCPIKRV